MGPGIECQQLPALWKKGPPPNGAGSPKHRTHPPGCPADLQLDSSLTETGVAEGCGEPSAKSEAGESGDNRLAFFNK